MACYPVQSNEQGEQHRTQRQEGKSNGCLRWQHLLLALGVLLGLTDHRAQAQGTSAPIKRYMNDHLIVLPIHIDPKSRNEIQKLLLYVKKSAKAPWKLAGNISPSQNKHVFNAPADGEYYFTLVTVNKFGRPSVANVDSQAAQAVVVLDRQPPNVQIRRALHISPGICIQIKIDDANPNDASTYVEYQTRDKVWRPLQTVAGRTNTYCIPSQAAITGLIRVTAIDRCGNKKELQAHLQDMPSEFGHESNMIAKTIPPQPPAPNKNTRKVYPPKEPNPHPVNPDTPKPVSDKQVPMPPLPDGMSRNSSKSIVPVEHQANLGPAVKELINHTNLVLNYAIDAVGPSGVGKVEVWVTKDYAKHWELLTEDTDRKSPIEINLPGDGLYGLSIVARNGFGFGGQPPKAGDHPDSWVEVDTVNPEIQLKSIDLVRDAKPMQVLVSWQASDKNLVDNGISLYYSSQPTGPWNVIAERVNNTGRYRWALPTGVGGKLYFRISASDRAHNVAISQSQEPTQLDDLSRPKVRIQSISFGDEHSSAPRGVANEGQLDSLQPAPPSPKNGPALRP